VRAELGDRTTARRYVPAALHGAHAVLLLSITVYASVAVRDSGAWATLALYIVLVPTAFAALIAGLFAIGWARVAPATTRTERRTRAVGAGTAVGQLLVYLVWVVNVPRVGLLELAPLYGIFGLINLAALVSYRR